MAEQEDKTSDTAPEEQHARQEHFVAMLRDFRTAMLATHSLNGEVRARPMVLAEVDDEHALWLLSDVNSEKIDELNEDARVSVTLQDAHRFASVSGKAEVLRDSSHVRRLWSEAWRVWFPDGPNDANIVLIRVEPQHGEYWDASAMSRSKYLYRAAKAYLTGERPALTGELHSKVGLQH